MRKLCSYEGPTPSSTFAGWLADLWKGVSLKMNQQLPHHRMRLRKPKICQGIRCKSNTPGCCTHKFKHVWKRLIGLQLTTEAFSRPMWGTAPGVHLLLTSLQTSRRVTMVEGLVAHFTSDKPLAQAEDDANHKKAKAAVTKRSWEKKKWSV